MCETKLVTYKHLKIGQEIRGAKNGSHQMLFSARVKAINPSYITIIKYGIEEIISTEYMFEVAMTEDEIRKKYGKKAKEVFDALQNRLNLDEIGKHEMWNAWVSYDPYEMAAYCIKEKMTILGVCPDVYNHNTWNVGICACYENGEKFWCHFSGNMLETMSEMYPELV